MEANISLSMITALRQFGNQLLQCQDIHEVVQILLEKIEQEIRPQVTSIFLFSKEGRIQRFKIHGIDYQLQPIDDSWLPEESYLPGESFSGKAAAPPENSSSPYGEPNICQNLDQDIEKNKFINGDEYKKKLGFLKCGVSVPLNGANRTFGTIEVLNKIDKATKIPNRELIFTDTEICWLTVIGAHASAAINRLREADESKVYTNISHLLADPQDAKRLAGEAYKSVTDQLVGELMPYKVCILRFLEGEEWLCFVEESHTDDVDIKLKGYASRNIKEGMVGEVFHSGEPIVIERIEDEIHRFSSETWIKDQKLKSFICFPLKIQGEVIGILSLFIGYEHRFTKDNMDFLKNVSYLLAVYRVGVKRADEASKKVEKNGGPSFQISKKQKTELEEQFYIIKNKRKVLAIKFATVLGQITLGLLVFIGFLYIVLAPYFNPDLYSRLPRFSDLFSAFIVTIVFLWLYLRFIKARVILLRIRQASMLWSWSHLLITRASISESKSLL